MREVAEELKALRLYGMAARGEIWKPRGRRIQSSRWLITHLLEAEQTDRAMRSIQLSAQSRQVSGPSRLGWI